MFKMRILLLLSSPILGSTLGGVDSITALPSGSSAIYSGPFYTGPSAGSWAINRIGADELAFASGVRRATLSGISLTQGYRDLGFNHPIFNMNGSGYPGIDGANIATITSGGNVIGAGETVVGSALIGSSAPEQVGSTLKRR